MKQDKNINKFDTYENFNIPHNWERKKIKHLFVIGRGRVISQEEVSSEEKYPVFSSQTQNNGCLGYISTFDYNCTQLTWTTDGANAGTVFIREGKHNCTNVCGTLLPRTNTISIPFASFSLNYFCQFYKRPDTNGAKIMNNEMAEITIILPETKKQIKIAKFLTYEEEKTHNLIQKQQQLIELLKEKRQAVISHAVTKGLNPDAPMKDSGVEWLGQVPIHWSISKVRYCFLFDKGLTITKENLQDDGIPCINYGEIHSKYGFEINPNIHKLKCVNEAHLKNDKSSLLIKGDIIFADTSEDVDGSGNFSQLTTHTNLFAGYHTIIARPIDRKNYRFLAYIFDCQELRSQIKYAVKGVKVYSITQAILRGLSIWLPPKNEQEYISTLLDYRTAKIDTLIQKQLKQIELLKERRTALIAAAVTGKIDLRDWTPPASSSEESLAAEEATA
ncbi:TPA: restriction endonuclease subunit S [Enterobacter mori]|uniref:restriction endonuclease subunit S n=1 Tax=Enterobacter mori TaxID=539813 RepID=UPI002DC04C72|nr:restriction endonuclease subunit S [Enterobacter mori]MEB7565218.1 restriction endonuclease subunit S [Enterobacter mori]HDR2835874.1 restriction endonuclease subunit S [Enterobacter mori]